MAGVRELVEAMAPVLIAQWSITNPARTISTVRIAGSTDATYGTAMWAPPIDGSPFAVISVLDSKAKETETNRLWVYYTVQIFLGIVQADEPGALFNYNDQALAWMDTFIQVIAANRHMLPTSQTLSPTIGDVEWTYQSSTLRVRHEIFNRNYYGVEFRTQLCIVNSVNWQ